MGVNGLRGRLRLRARKTARIGITIAFEERRLRHDSAPASYRPPDSSQASPANALPRSPGLAEGPAARPLSCLYPDQPDLPHPVSGRPSFPPGGSLHFILIRFLILSSPFSVLRSSFFAGGGLADNDEHEPRTEN